METTPLNQTLTMQDGKSKHERGEEACVEETRVDRVRVTLTPYSAKRWFIYNSVLFS